jgi:hypothetical protein
MELNEILKGTENALIIVRRDDLLDFAKTYADKILESKPEPAKVSDEIEAPISQQEAIKFLGKSRQTLIEWRRKGFISGHRLGGRIYYLKSELIAAMK